MIDLGRMQDAFGRGLLGDDLSAISPHVAKGGAPVDERLAVYRNNSRVLTRAALGDTFPIVRELVGDDFFKGLANEFVRAHPPRSAALLFYGEELPDFIDGFEPARVVPYLGDMARLEWAIHLAHHAADTTSTDLGGLNALPEADLPGVRFALSPDLSLVRSVWAIDQIRRAHLGEMAFEDVRIDDGPAHVVVRRVRGTVQVTRTAAGDWRALQAFKAGESLGSAVAAGINQDFDPGVFLTWFFSSALITGYS